MKKILLAVAVFLGMGFSQANAQNVSLGFKTEGNVSNFILSGMEITKSNMKAGVSLGGFAKVDLCEHFALQPELLYSYKTSESKTLETVNTYEFWSVEVPVYAMGQCTLSTKSRIYAGLGPYVGFGLKGKITESELNLYEKNGNDAALLQRFDFGIGATLGYELNAGLQFNVSYKLALIDALDAGNDNATMLPSTISFGLGYRF